jgi:hypothetical protein
VSNNVITWAVEFWQREMRHKPSDREEVMSMSRLYVIKQEASGYVVNSAGFIHRFDRLSDAAALAGIEEWRAVEDIMVQKKVNIVLVNVYPNGRITIQ